MATDADPLAALLEKVEEERSQVIKILNKPNRKMTYLDDPADIAAFGVDMVVIAEPADWQEQREALATLAANDMRQLFEAAAVAYPELEYDFLEPMEAGRLAMFDAVRRYIATSGAVDETLDPLTVVGQMLWTLGKRVRRQRPVATVKSDADAPAENQDEDDTAYIPASMIMGRRFNSLATMGRWIKSEKNTTIKWRPAGKGYEVHSGDWFRHWAAKDKARQQLADAEDAAEEAAEEARNEVVAEVRDIIADQVAQYLSEWRASDRR